MKKKHKKVKKKERIIIPLEAIRYEQEEVDMISDLPDPIIHQILSLLPTKQAEQTQILSKRWLNLWLTYPIIDLDFDLKRFIKDQNNIYESERGRRVINYREHVERRLDEYMQRTLETRDLTYLQKLRIGRIDQSMQSSVDKYIALALRNNVSVLNLSFKYYGRRYGCEYSASPLLSLRSLIFLRLKYCSFDDYNNINLKSLKTLNLKCVRLNATKEIFCKMISSCPLLETLTLIDSNLQDYSSSFEICHTSLKYLEVQHSHYGILELDVPKLLSLTCTVMEGSHRGRGIEIKTLKVDSLCSLTTLSLSALSMKEEHLQRLLLSSPHLERVGLRYSKIKNNTPKIIIPNLKELVVKYCRTNEGSIMDVDTSNLESLIFKWSWHNNTYKFRDSGDMGFGKLTKLSFSGDFLEDSCPKDDDGILLLSTHFPALEDLSLEYCHDIEHLKFSSKSLKRLYVEHCTNLKDVNIDAQNLVFFKYFGYMIEVSNLIKSSQFEAELILYVTENHHSSSSSHSYSCDSGYQDTQLMKLRNFVKMFNETRLLTLINMSAKLIEQTLKMDHGRYNKPLLTLSYRRDMISIDLESNSIELKFRKSAEVEDGGRIDELVCVKVGDGCVKASVMEEFLVDFEGGFHRRMQEIIENLVAGKLKSMVVEADFESHNELPYYYLSEDEVAHHALNSKQNRKWKKRVKSGPAEKKTKSPESSPAPSATSPQSQTSSPAATKDETFNSELEVSEEVSDIKEAEEMEPGSESNGGDSELKEDAEQDENGTDSSQSTFSYDQLKAKSDNPITGIDFKRRETYLSDEEFESIFGVTKEAFYKLPKWKQDMQKRKVDLF